MPPAMAGFAKSDKQMIRVVPGHPKQLETYEKMVLTMVNLQIIYPFAVNTLVLVARQDLLSFGLPLGMKEQRAIRPVCLGGRRREFGWRRLILR